MNDNTDTVSVKDSEKEMARKLWALLKDRFLGAKKPFSQVATIARQSFAGEPDIHDDATPPVHWEEFRNTVFDLIGRLIEGSPTITVRTDEDELSPLAEWFQNRIEGVLDYNEFSSLVIEQFVDAAVCGMGYNLVERDPADRSVVRIISPDYFDVYIDSALAKTYNIHTGRTIYCRRFINRPDFLDLYGKKLKLKSPDEFKTKDNLSELDSNNIPGRDIAGISVQARSFAGGESLENYTGPSNINRVSPGDAKINMETDSLVECWEIWQVNPESPSGWTRYFMYDGIMLEEPVDLREHWERPPIQCMAFDIIRNQGYQPSLYVHLDKNQYSVNYLWHRMLRHISNYVDSPMIYSERGDVKAGFASRVSGMVDDVIKFIRGESYKVSSMGEAPKLMEQPRIPGEYLKLTTELRDISQDNKGIFDVMRGQETPQATSGRAIGMLQKKGELRLLHLPERRNKMFKETALSIALTIYDIEYDKAREQAEALNQENEDYNTKMYEYNMEQIEAGNDIESYMEKPTDMPPEQFMPPIFQNITPEIIKKGLVFSFNVTNKMSKDEEIAYLMENVERHYPVMLGIYQDPKIALEQALRLAGKVISNVELAEDLIETIDQGEEDLIQKYPGFFAQEEEVQEEEGEEEEEEETEPVMPAWKQRIIEKSLGGDISESQMINGIAAERGEIL